MLEKHCHRLTKMWSKKVANIQRWIRHSHSQSMRCRWNVANENVCNLSIYIIDRYLINFMILAHYKRLKLGRRPVDAICHQCHQRIRTLVDFRTSFLTHATASSIFCLGYVTPMYVYKHASILYINWSNLSFHFILKQIFPNRMDAIRLWYLQNGQSLLSAMLCIYRTWMKIEMGWKTGLHATEIENC